jgi:hypothetical protein
MYQIESGGAVAEGRGQIVDASGRSTCRGARARSGDARGVRAAVAGSECRLRRLAATTECDSCVKSERICAKEVQADI